MKRVAYLSPLPPEASGIADYSVELLPGLRQRFEIDLFSAARAELPPPLAGLAVAPYGRFPDMHARRPYDAVVYQLGNNADFHTDIYRLALRIPGIVVLHEYMLHHLLRGITSPGEYIEVMRYSYGEAGARVARRLLETDHPAESWTYPLFEPIVDASVSVIVHSHSARRRVLRSRPTARVAVVPLHLSLSDLPRVTVESRSALRRELGVPDGALVFASFGIIAPAKRIEVAIRAFARFRRRHPQSVYVLAGELPRGYTRVPDMLKGELGEGVVVTGRLTLPRLLEVMDLCDVAINLRHPEGGETSATCVRLLGLGKPVIVSASGWFSDIPPGCCATVDTGRLEEEELVAVLETLAADPGLRADMGAAARRWAATGHDLDGSVELYAREIESAAAAAPPARPVMPSDAPHPGTDVATALLVEIAAAAGDLGVRENDTQLLPSIAAALVEAGLTTRRTRS